MTPGRSRERSMVAVSARLETERTQQTPAVFRIIDEAGAKVAIAFHIEDAMRTARALYTGATYLVVISDDGRLFGWRGPFPYSSARVSNAVEAWRGRCSSF